MSDTALAPPRIDPARLWADIEGLAAITEPDRPWTRRSFSPLFAQGRAYLRARMEEIGLEVRVDAAGNLIGRRDGTEPGLGTIALGSHSDTVPGGGRFDGIAGVAGALAVARALAESGERLRHPLEAIDFLAEEPSEFGLSCIGSRGITGAFAPAMLDMTDGQGRRLGDALAAAGRHPSAIGAGTRDDIAAFLELHIEQGPVLEAEGIDIGVVTAIVGIRRIEARFRGQAAHAGTAPMHLRRDAAYAGALLIAAVRERAEALAAAGEGYFVATVGIVEVLPGGSNVVPRSARIVIDARSSNPALTDRFARRIEDDAAAIAVRARVDLDGFDILSDGPPALCDEGLRAHLHAASEALGCSHVDIASGAGHDAAFMTRICPSAMIFTPCLRGMSHIPDEWSEPNALAAATAVMLETVRRIDRGG